MVLNKIICEKKLPIPWEDFSDEDKNIFDNIKWDEEEFYTSSFFDSDILPSVYPVYTITEDGQFYKSLTEIKFEENEKGEITTSERDGGIEKQEFTGEIYFGTEILKDDHDYLITFKALFYKGELKELKMEEWSKRSSEKRKKIEKKILENIKEIEKLKKSNFRSSINWTLLKVISLMRWVLFVVFKILLKIESWVIIR